MKILMLTFSMMAVLLAFGNALGEETPRESRIDRHEAALRAKAATRTFQSRPRQASLPVTAKARLGALLFQDADLSLNRNQSCQSCHALRPVIDPTTNKRLRAAGFVDPGNVTGGSAVSAGSIVTRTGSLNSPSVGYAAFSPNFHWDAAEGLYVGGQFWNGRADDLSEQAEQPFLNPVEMAMPSKWAVVSRLKENPAYRRMFDSLFGIDLSGIPSYELAPATAKPPAAVLFAYESMADAIAEFETRRHFNRFTSKFDFVLAGKTSFTPQEQQGFDLFNGRGRCNACHISDAGIAPDGSVLPPLFTDFTYDNIGVPRNRSIPGNPRPDVGLGGRADVAARDPSGADLGKHKVMTLRNIDVTPPYAHNGVFPSLEAIVHFYNTRDVLGSVADNRSAGFGVTGWPAPEIPRNVNRTELGDLGLTAAEEAAIVAFMKTLTDSYPAWGGDPNVPPGTMSPFAATPRPPFAR